MKPTYRPVDSQRILEARFYRLQTCAGRPKVRDACTCTDTCQLMLSEGLMDPTTILTCAILADLLLWTIH